MRNGFSRHVLLATVFLAALAGGAPALADDLAERQALTKELLTIVPYGQAEVERDLVQGIDDGLKQAYGPAYTAYAKQETRAVARSLLAELPPLEQVTRDALVTKLTPEELREAIRFTRSPVAVKLRRHETELNAAATPEAQGELFAKLFTPAELDEIVAMMQRPAIVKYMTVLKEAAQPIGVLLGEKLFAGLQSRCAKRTEPLPWCRA